MRWILVVAAALFGAAGIVHAGTIGLSDFGPQARIDTFDYASVGNYAGNFATADVTYGFSAPGGYRFVAYDPLNYLCVSGVCLSNNVTGVTWIITLNNPVDRVGGFLTGAADSLILSRTSIGFYDADGILLGTTIPVTLVTFASSPAFFGFQTNANRIQTIRIDPRSDGPFVTTLDNFTFEVVQPSPVPLSPASLNLLAGICFLALLAWRRKRQLQHARVCAEPRSDLAHTRACTLFSQAQ
jgi:hypothetical protein